jgi:hypothetical protein
MSGEGVELKELWNSFWQFAWKDLLEQMVTPASGVGTVQELGSGYSTEADRAARVAELQAVCLATVEDPALAAGDVTHCNEAAARIAQAMGCGALFGLMANEQLHRLATLPDCREDSIERAHAHALRGGLAFACLEEYPHGHIATFYPGPLEYSTSWGCLVPPVANVGRQNGIMRISGAFTAADRPRVRCFLVGQP